MCSRSDAFERLLCRIYSSIIWVHVQHVHGSSSESQERTVHICKGTWLLRGNSLCNPASWSYSSDQAAVHTPAMPGNLKQIASAQRECAKVSLHTVTPASPFLLYALLLSQAPVGKGVVISPFQIAEVSIWDCAGILKYVTHCRITNTCFILGDKNETWLENWIVVNEEDLAWY